MNALPDAYDYAAIGAGAPELEEPATCPWCLREECTEECTLARAKASRARAREAARPWRPILDALEAYGVDLMLVPETTTVTHAHHGIVLDVMVRDENGDIAMDEDAHGRLADFVTRQKFYRHPERADR